MAFSYKPQNGFDTAGHETGVTSYPYDYKQNQQTIVSTTYQTEKDGGVVTCFIKLSNDVIVSGVHEQFENINIELFKGLAYQKAIDRAEQLGYKLNA